MARADLEAVARLEEEEPSGWSRLLIEEELNRESSILLVAASDALVCGWCGARFLQEEAELLRICVAQKHRRCSLATMLLLALQHELQKSGVTRIYLEVRAENQAAISFYSPAGFTPVGRRINYYTQPRDDALILKKIIG